MIRTTRLVVAVALLVGCHDPDGPTSPQLPNDIAAAVVSPGIKTPSNVSAVALSEAQIVINWQDSQPDETGFEVHRSVSGASGTFTPLATTAADVLTYNDGQLSPLTLYCYRVRAVRVIAQRIAYSAFSNTACATTPLPPPPPPPANVTAVGVSATQIDISWQDQSANETGFQVHRSLTGVSGSFALVATTGANVQSYGNTGLAPATQHCYQIRAVLVVAGNTIYSTFANIACATTPPLQPPAAASGATARPSGSSVVLVSWIDNSSTEDGFRLYQSIDGGTVWGLVATTGPNGGITNVPAVAEQPACYRVVAYNAAGDASPSNASCTTTPAGPTNLVVTRVDTETVALTWSDNSAVEDGYEVWFLQTNCIGACDTFDPWCEYYGMCAAGRVRIAVLPANSISYTGSNTLFVRAGYAYEVFYVVAMKDGATSDWSPMVWLP